MRMMRLRRIGSDKPRACRWQWRVNLFMTLTRTMEAWEHGCQLRDVGSQRSKDALQEAGSQVGFHDASHGLEF